MADAHSIRLFSLSLMFAASIFPIFAQDQPDAIYLRTGKVIRGVIIEKVSNDYVKIQREDGSVEQYSYSEIERIVQSTRAKPRPYEIVEVDTNHSVTFLLAGGAGIPLGEFSSTKTELAGFALTGWTIGAQLTYQTSQLTFLAIGFSLSSNSVDETELKKAIGLPSSIGLSVGKYSTVLVSLGLGFRFPIQPGSHFYLMGQLGPMFASTPSITVSSSGVGSTQEAVSATAFGYGGAAGFQNPNIDLGVRYLAGKPAYEFADNEYEQPTAIFQIVIGFIL